MSPPATKEAGAKRKSGSTPTKATDASSDSSAPSAAKLHRDVTALEEAEAANDFDGVAAFSSTCDEVRTILAKVLSVRTGKAKAKPEEMQELRTKVMRALQNRLSK